MIKNLVFDFGDVFINLDKKATLNQLQKLGIDEISSEMVYIAEQFEIGTLTSKEFISRCTILFPSISENNIKKAWNAILKDFPLYRFDFLKSLANSKKYRLFLLSNTNAIHISWIQKEWGDLFNEFKSFFEQFYLSHEIHLRKPSVEIYKFVLDENKLKAEETFFIDDLEENTRTAKNLGIKVWNIDPFHEDVIDLFLQKDFIT